MLISFNSREEEEEVEEEEGMDDRDIVDALERDGLTVGS